MRSRITARTKAIEASKRTALLQKILRFNRDGTPTEYLGSFYSIIPIPTIDTYEVQNYRLWIAGHAGNQHTTQEACMKEMLELVALDPDRDSSDDTDDYYPSIPF